MKQRLPHRLMIFVTVVSLLAPATWAQETQPATEEDLALALVEKLTFENDPALKLRNRMDLVYALLSQARMFRMKLKKASRKVQGSLQDSRENSEGVETQGESATAVYHLAFSAPGPFELGGTRKGKPQYWTVQGTPTQFIVGSSVWQKILVRGRLRRPGIKSVMFSLPPASGLSEVEGTTAGGRSILPVSGLQSKEPLTYRTLLGTLARILGKLKRLPPKKDATAMTVQPMERGKSLRLEALRFKFRMLKAGVFALRIPPPGDLRAARLNQAELKIQVPGAPAPEGESAQTLFLALEAGEYELEVPVGGSGTPSLEIQELDEGGEAYQTLLKDLGFSAEGLDAPVTLAALEKNIAQLAQILRPLAVQEDQLQIALEQPISKEKERVTQEWDWQFPEARPPISPVTPAGQ